MQPVVRGKARSGVRSSLPMSSSCWLRPPADPVAMRSTATNCDGKDCESGASFEGPVVGWWYSSSKGSFVEREQRVRWSLGQGTSEVKVMTRFHHLPLRRGGGVGQPAGPRARVLRSGRVGRKCERGIGPGRDGQPGSDRLPPTVVVRERPGGFEETRVTGQGVTEHYVVALRGGGSPGRAIRSSRLHTVGSSCAERRRSRSWSCPRASSTIEARRCQVGPVLAHSGTRCRGRSTTRRSALTAFSARSGAPGWSRTSRPPTCGAPSSGRRMSPAPRRSLDRPPTASSMGRRAPPQSSRASAFGRASGCKRSPGPRRP